MNLVSGLPYQPINTSTLRLVNSWIDPKTLRLPRISTTIVHDVPDSDRIQWNRQRTIYLQTEPEVITPQRQFLLKNWRRFHSIVTYDDEVLRMCPNAKKYLCGGCWIHPSERNKTVITDKEFRVSTIVGWKAMGEGHRLRQLIYKRQTEMKIPYTFFRSSHDKIIEEITTNPIYKHDSKFELFRTFQFSLIIENSKQLNYFTEKLIDCFITKTVPIYWGCPNIGEYFLTEGMILLQSSTVEEFFEKVSNLTPDTYSQMLPMIEQNYQRCLQYVTVEDNINRALRSIADY